MKTILIFLLFVISVAAHSRQYIQCADNDSWDRVVINLNGDRSTLFMTNGVHLPDEDRVDVLKPLSLAQQDAYETTYKTSQGRILEYVKIPNAMLGVASNYFEISMGHLDQEGRLLHARVMGCFSSVYAK